MLDRLIDSLPLIILAAVMWFGSYGYTQHKLHVQADENLSVLTEALVNLIQQQQGGGGQGIPNPDSALVNPTQELPTPK